MGSQKIWTISSIFLVPVLGLDREKLNELGFVNGYSADADKEGVYQEDSLFLLFKPPNLYKFKEFVEEQYETNHFLIDDYDYEEGYVVLVYMLNKRWEEDYKLIKKSKYSKVSDDFKNLFEKNKTINVLGKKEQVPSLQWRIFNKEPSLKEVLENSINLVEVRNNYSGKKEWKELDKVNEVKETIIRNSRASVYLSDDSEFWGEFNIEKETLKLNGRTEI